MRPFRRDPRHLDALALFSHLDQPSDSRSAREALNNPDRIHRGWQDAITSLRRVLQTPSAVYGWLTQHLFGALVAALGQVELVHQLDAGEGFYSGDPPKVPDYVIVMDDGERLFVEVKSHGGDPRAGFSLSAGERDGLMRYATLMGGRSVLAVFWAHMNMWSLVDLSSLERNETSYWISFKNAMIRNEFGLLGDAMIGAQHPLEFRIYFAEDSIEAPGPEPDTTLFEGTIAKVEVACRGAVITRPEEQKIAMSLMMYGRWHEEERIHRRDGRAEAISYLYAPEVPASEEHPSQDFDIVGSLSSIYSARFMDMTLSEGEPNRLRVDVVPSELGDLIADDYQGEVLHLWRLRQQPAVPTDPDGSP